MKIVTTLAVSSLLLVSLSGCLATQEHLSQDFGSATRQDMAAQIADPDAKYVGDPAPGSNGGRVAQAQDRYQTGKVIEPVAAASKVYDNAAATASPQ